MEIRAKIRARDPEVLATQVQRLNYIQQLELADDGTHVDIDVDGDMVNIEISSDQENMLMTSAITDELNQMALALYQDGLVLAYNAENASEYIVSYGYYTTYRINEKGLMELRVVNADTLFQEGLDVQVIPMTPTDEDPFPVYIKASSYDYDSLHSSLNAKRKHKVKVMGSLLKEQSGAFSLKLTEELQLELSKTFQNLAAEVTHALKEEIMKQGSYIDSYYKFLKLNQMADNSNTETKAKKNKL